MFFFTWVNIGNFLILHIKFLYDIYPSSLGIADIWWHFCIYHFSIFLNVPGKWEEQTDTGPVHKCLWPLVSKGILLNGHSHMVKTKIKTRFVIFFKFTVWHLYFHLHLLYRNREKCLHIKNNLKCHLTVYRRVHHRHNIYPYT